jgi:hypothetical protein
MNSMITRQNYEEAFLLYLDNELSPADRLSVEVFVKENPDLQEEFETFRQCRLIPEDGPSFGNPAPLLKYAGGEGRFLPLATYRMTRIAAAVLLLLLAGSGVFIAMKKNNGSAMISGGAIHANNISPDNSVSYIKPSTPQSGSSAPRSVTSVPQSDSFVRQSASSAPSLLSSSQSGSSASDPSAKKDQGSVTPRRHGALYLVTTHQQQDSGEPIEEKIPDQMLAGTRIPVQRRVTLIDPANTRAPEKIFIADINEGQPDQPYPQPAGSSGASFAIQTTEQDPSSSSAEGLSEQVPTGKNKLGGVFRKISRALEKTRTRNDDDRHAILIGNLQIALN